MYVAALATATKILNHLRIKHDGKRLLVDAQLPNWLQQVVADAGGKGAWRSQDMTDVPLLAESSAAAAWDGLADCICEHQL